VGVRAIVTGATGVVGRACAVALAGRGCALTLVGRRGEALDALADELTGSAGRPEVLIVDAGSGGRFAVPDGWRGERLLLVNAAAVFGPLAPFAEVDLDRWLEVMEINFLSAVSQVHAVLPVMIEAGWGRVVQVSSAAARDVPGPYNSAYVVSKSAVDRTLAHLATELGGTGVTVHALHPGEIVSNMRDDIAEQAAADPRLATWTGWAERTAAHGDDVTVAAAWVADLLDDEFAAAMNGRFGYPQRGDSAPL
jgi:3-oxoacyl-[acyl-carrier protein] reductase